jgi:hypothetical protein
MFVASSRPTARKITRRLSVATGTSLALLLCLGSASALAARGWPEAPSAPRGAPEAPSAPKAAPEALSAVQAVCPGQTFAQTFTSLGDSSYYTLVAGSEFNGSAEGWELFGGAHVASTTRPDGSSGGALDLPSGSAAVSPPVCVTLQYPTARIWMQSVEGKSNVTVGVAYASARSTAKARAVGSLDGEEGSAGHGESGTWQLSEPFEVDPQLGGKAEEVREVRFIFYAGGRGSDTQLYGLYVDPRMR